MQSMTMSSILVRKQINYNKCNSDDKNCQSAKKQSNHKKYEYIKCLCDDKNCQAAKWNMSLKGLISIFILGQQWKQMLCGQY